METKIVGNPCTTCNTPYIQGKKGAYCKPCYVKWAEANKPQQTQPAQSNKPEPNWEAKDRTSIAQTCIKSAADIYSGTGNTENIKALAEKFYQWITEKRNDGNVAEDMGVSGEVSDVDVSQIPF